ncbi:MAG: hypothetical protein MJE63_12265 [Proteobacteria bacterium]|nr:hypothetical protein [Pseudomonadota bacterium]
MKRILIVIAFLFANYASANSDTIPSLNCSSYNIKESQKYYSNPIERDYLLRIIYPRRKIDLLCEFGKLKELTTFPNSIDPNFLNGRSSDFSGILLTAVMKSLRVQEKNIMVLTKDNYFFLEKLKNITEHSGMIARYSKGKEIPVRFDGPIKLVYKNIRNVSAYPWYMRTVIFGDSFTKELVLLSKNGEIIKFNKSRLLKLVKHPKVGIPLNRGYYPSVKIQKHPGLNVVALEDVLNSAKRNNINQLTFISFGGHKKTVKINNTRDLYLAIYDFEKTYFPITGGQYLVVRINNRNVHPFIYYLEGIYLE